MHTRYSHWSLCPLLLALLGLAACGGGGGVTPGDGTGTGTGSPGASGVAVDAGADVQTSEGALVTLNATITDPGGLSPTLQWTQVSGPTTALTGDTTSTCSFTAPAAPAGDALTLEFECAATSSLGTTTDAVSVSVASGAFVLLDRASSTEVLAVYRTDVLAGTTSRVSHVTATDRGVSSWQASPDGRYVAYRVDGDVDFQRELYVAPVDGSSHTKVSPPLPTSGDVYHSFYWSPDSTRIAFLADTTINGVEELYTVRVDGTGLSRCHPPMASGEVIRDVQWSPSGTHIAFTKQAAVLDTYRLFAAQADGSSSTEVSGAPPAGTPFGAASFKWAPDGSRIAYLGDFTTVNVFELYAVAPTGAARNKLNGALTPGGTVRSTSRGFEWASDSSRVCYLATQDDVAVYGLYSSLADGTDNRRLDNHAPGQFGVSLSTRILWAPDSSRVLYLADERVPATTELFSVLADGTGHAQVSSPITASGRIETDYRWLADSARVLYGLTPQPGTANTALWVASSNGAQQTLVSAASASDEGAYAGLPSPDGTRLAWQRYDVTTTTFSLWTANTDGTGRTQVSPPLTPPASIVAGVGLGSSYLSWSKDGTRVLYATTPDQGAAPPEQDWFVVRSDGSDNKSVLGSPTGGSPITSFSGVWGN